MFFDGDLGLTERRVKAAVQGWRLIDVGGAAFDEVPCTKNKDLDVADLAAPIRHATPQDFRRAQGKIVSIARFRQPDRSSPQQR